MRLLLAEFRRSSALYWRYPGDVLSGLAMLFITFFALLMGAQYIAGPAAQLGSRMDSLILGYWLWTLSIFALTNTANMIQSESVAGTLEQLYLSPYGPLRIFVARAIASLGLNLLTSGILLGVMLLLTGRRLDFSLHLLAPLFAVLLGAYGVGLTLGGLALVMKQVSRLVNLTQFFILFLVVVPIEETASTWVRFIPIASGAALLRDVMARRSELDPGWLATALLVGTLTFVLGVGAFRIADRRARHLGLLSQY